MYGEVINIVSQQKGTEGVTGDIQGNQINLKHVSFLRNSNAPIFRGSITACPEGTVIMGTFITHAREIKIFMWVVRAFALLMSLLALLSVIPNGFNMGVVVFVAGPLIMCLLSFAVERYFSSIGEEDKYEILQFIQRELSAMPHNL